MPVTRHTRISASALALLTAPALPAWGVFTITDANATFSTALTPFLPDSTLSTANFLPDPAAPDQLFYYNWAYRAPGGGNRGFSWIDTPVQTVAGNTVTLVYTNAGPNPVGFNRFNARLTIRIFDAFQPLTARVESTLDFQADAANAGPTSWEIFNVNDFDVGGTPAGDTYTVLLPTAVSGSAIDGPNTMNFIGVNANRFEVGTGSAVRAKVTGGVIQNLTNAPGPITGDGAVGYQWSVTLNPGQSVQFKSGFGLNMPPIAPPCVCDQNFDGAVDTSDLVVLLANFGNPVPPFTMGDLNGDGVVNTLDIVIFLACFGTPC